MTTRTTRRIDGALFVFAMLLGAVAMAESNAPSVTAVNIDFTQERGLPVQRIDGFTPIDYWVLIQLFDPIEAMDASTGEVRRSLQIRAYRPAPQPDAPTFALESRKNRLYDTFYHLMQGDEEFASLFRSEEAQLLTALPEGTVERFGRRVIYDRLKSAGVFARLIESAGPEELRPMPSGMVDPWGRDNKLLAVQITTNSGLPPATRIVDYCAGLKGSGGSGLKIDMSGVDPYSAAHLALFRTEEYRDLFRKTIAPYEERALALNPLDGKGERRLRKELRLALVESGIAAQLEGVVSQQARNRTKAQDGPGGDR